MKTRTDKELKYNICRKFGQTSLIASRQIRVGEQVLIDKSIVSVMISKGTEKEKDSKNVKTSSQDVKTSSQDVKVSSQDVKMSSSDKQKQKQHTKQEDNITWRLIRKIFASGLEEELITLGFWNDLTEVSETVALLWSEQDEASCMRLMSVLGIRTDVASADMSNALKSIKEVYSILARYAFAVTGVTYEEKAKDMSESFNESLNETQIRYLKVLDKFERLQTENQNDNFDEEETEVREAERARDIEKTRRVAEAKQTKKTQIIRSFMNTATIATVGLSLFSTVSIINHSCRPNCVLSTYVHVPQILENIARDVKEAESKIESLSSNDKDDKNDKEHDGDHTDGDHTNGEHTDDNTNTSSICVVTAMQNIQEGEEITISYIAPALLSRWSFIERQTFLKQTCGFKCHCVRCLQDSEYILQAVSRFILEDSLGCTRLSKELWKSSSKGLNLDAIDMKSINPSESSESSELSNSKNKTLDFYIGKDAPRATIASKLPLFVLGLLRSYYMEVGFYTLFPEDEDEDELNSSNDFNDFDFDKFTNGIQTRAKKMVNVWKVPEYYDDLFDLMRFIEKRIFNFGKLNREIKESPESDKKDRQLELEYVIVKDKRNDFWVERVQRRQKELHAVKKVKKEKEVKVKVKVNDQRKKESDVVYYSDDEQDQQEREGGQGNEEKNDQRQPQPQPQLDVLSDETSVFLELLSWYSTASTDLFPATSGYRIMFEMPLFASTQMCSEPTCLKPVKLSCGKCFSSYYCSEEHLKKHKTQHQRDCVKVNSVNSSSSSSSVSVSVSASVRPASSSSLVSTTSSSSARFSASSSVPKQANDSKQSNKSNESNKSNTTMTQQLITTRVKPRLPITASQQAHLIKNLLLLFTQSFPRTYQQEPILELPFYQFVDKYLAIR